MRRHDLTNKKTIMKTNTEGDNDKDKDKDEEKDIFENILKERTKRLLTFDTFDQRDDETKT